MIIQKIYYAHLHTSTFDCDPFHPKGILSKSLKMLSTYSYHKLVSSTIIICFVATSVTSRAYLTLTKALSLPKATHNNSSKHSQNNLTFIKFLYLFRVLFTSADSFNNDTRSPQVGFHGGIFFR